VRRARRVLPAADEERRRVGAGVGEDLHPGRRLPAVLDEVRAERLPLLPELPEAAHAALPAQRPDVDVLAADARIGAVDRLGDELARRAVVDEHRPLRRRERHAARHGEAAHVRLVGLRHLERRVEEVEHRHRPGGLPLGEARGVLERVDGGAPERDAPVLQPAVELLERVARLVEQAPHAAVHDAGHLRARVDAPEAEERVRAHLGGLAGLRHEPLAERHHDGVVLGERAGEVPEPLAHHVRADGVGGLLHLVVGRLVLAGAAPEPAEEPGAERGRRGGHRQAAADAAGREREVRDRLRLRPLDLDVLEPQVEAEEDGTGVERPLGDDVPLFDARHAAQSTTGAPAAAPRPSRPRSSPRPRATPGARTGRTRAARRSPCRARGSTRGRR
jgi:hypothetical protein